VIDRVTAFTKSRRYTAPGPTRLRMTLPQRVCPSGKTCFPTLDAAHTAADDAVTRGQVLPGCHQFPYACDECGQFHHGNRRVWFKESVE
jgi:hypothetical protein